MDCGGSDTALGSRGALGHAPFFPERHLQAPSAPF